MGAAALWDSGTWDESKWDIDTVTLSTGGGGRGTYNEERKYRERQKIREDAIAAKNKPKVELKVVARETPPTKVVADISGEVLKALMPEQDIMSKYDNLAEGIDTAVIEDQREKARIADINRIEEIARIKAIKEIEAELRRKQDDLAIMMMLGIL
tara:strand:+ start:30 stop:494 length:465 start_codon:yes stop_codon:yes gene_type:complete